MRILTLLLLLISIASFGQSKPKDEVSVTLSLLLEYEKHCFNDSTLVVHVYGPSQITEIGNGSYIVNSNFGYTIGRFQIKEKEVWIHKTPTFEGFLKWVRKKYKL